VLNCHFYHQSDVIAIKKNSEEHILLKLNIEFHIFKLTYLDVSLSLFEITLLTLIE